MALFCTECKNTYEWRHGTKEQNEKVEKFLDEYDGTPADIKNNWEKLEERLRPLVYIRDNGDLAVTEPIELVCYSCKKKTLFEATTTMSMGDPYIDDGETVIAGNPQFGDWQADPDIDYDDDLSTGDEF